MGEAESGAVKVTVDAQNRVVDISLTAKAMRLPSTDRLSKALLSACDAAVADVSKQLREAAGVAQDVDPLAGFFGHLDRCHDVSDHRPQRRHLEQRRRLQR